jgi:hypothetical protein
MAALKVNNKVLNTMLAALASAILLEPDMAHAAARFAAAPHFLLLEDRERIVFFTDGRVAGAVARQRPDGTIDVVVPGASVDESVATRSFDDAAAGGPGTMRLRLSSAAGDARIEIEHAGAVERVHAFAAGNPSRLTIDLLRERARPKTAERQERQAAGRRGGRDPGGTTANKEESRRAAPAAAASPAPAVDQKRAASAPTPAPSPAALVVNVDATRAAPPPSPTASAQPAGGPAKPGDAVATAQGRSAHGTSGPIACRWRRVAGTAYCAPDPTAAAYAADLGTERLAGQLDRAHDGPGMTPLASSGAAETHLNADVELVRRARDGWLLPVVALYEHALRTHPEFADAPRTRANLALVYHALGFTPELERLARLPGDPVAPFASALLASLLREEGETRDLEPLLATASAAGGFPACLAARVRAELAADRGDEDVAAEIGRLAKVCPRTIVEDAATSWLRARVQLAGGEASKAARALVALERELPRRERALLLSDLARAYRADGHAEAARRTEERLAGGAFGPRAIRRGRVALAALAAEQGRRDAVEAELAGLSPEDVALGRKKAELASAAKLIASGQELAALAKLAQHQLDVRHLSPLEQVALARALRQVGLAGEAEKTIRGLRVIAPARLPDEFWIEVGAQALAREDAEAALATADEWVAARGGEVPVGALVLRSRAYAAKGDGRAAAALVSEQIAALDPGVARDLAIEVAEQVRSADPAAALDLARTALEAQGLEPLAASSRARALRVVAEASEATGDAASAASAFARLADEHAGEPAAAGAAYRAARLAAPAAPVPAVAKTSPSPAPKSAGGAPVDDDPLAKRVAAVGRLYAELVAGRAMNEGKP